MDVKPLAETLQINYRSRVLRLAEVLPHYYYLNNRRVHRGSQRRFFFACSAMVIASVFLCGKSFTYRKKACFLQSWT